MHCGVLLGLRGLKGSEAAVSTIATMVDCLAKALNARFVHSAGMSAIAGTSCTVTHFSWMRVLTKTQHEPLSHKVFANLIGPKIPTSRTVYCKLYFRKVLSCNIINIIYQESTIICGNVI